MNHSGRLHKFTIKEPENLEKFTKAGTYFQALPLLMIRTGMETRFTI